MEEDLKIQRFSGSDVTRFIPDVPRLRIEEFREYAYLQDGDLECEAAYLRTYMAGPGSVTVTAFDKAQFIGAATGILLMQEMDEVTSFRCTGNKSR